jgi:O-antigen ligase
MSYSIHIVQLLGRTKQLKEWLVSALAIMMFSMLAYRLAFYPSSNMAPMIAVAIIALLTVWRPVIGLVIYLIAYPLVPSSGNVDIIKTGILALTVLLFFLWWYHNARVGAAPWIRAEYKWPFMFFLFLCFSPLLGLKYGFSVMDWARDIAPLLNLLLIPVMADYFRSPRYRWLLYLIFIPIAVGLLRDVLFLLARYGLADFSILTFFPVRLSTFHPGVFFGLGLTMFIQRAPQRWLWLSVSLLGAGVSFLTPTRTVWLALGFMVGLLLIFYSQHRRKAIGLILATLIVMGMLLFRSGGSATYSESQSSRYEQMLGYQRDLSVKNRLDEFYQTLDLFKSSPVYGVGFGFQYHFWRSWVRAYKGSGYFDTNYTHNDLTNFAAKGGISGLIIFGLMLYGLIKQLKKRRQQISDPISRIWATFGIIVIFQSLFVGLSTPVYQTREAIFLLTIIISLGLSYENEKANA